MPSIAIYAQESIIPVVIAVLAVATYTDFRFRIITNTLTLPAILVGLLLQYLGAGWTGLLGGVLGMGAGAGLMLIPFVFGQMGGGDVKLMAALGALLGAAAILNVFLYTTLAGGLLAMGIALHKREGLATLGRTWHLAKGLFIFRTAPIMESSSDKHVAVPYGLAIAAGALTYLLAGSII